MKVEVSPDPITGSSGLVFEGRPKYAPGGMDDVVRGVARVQYERGAMLSVSRQAAEQDLATRSGLAWLAHQRFEQETADQHELALLSQESARLQIEEQQERIAVLRQQRAIQALQLRALESPRVVEGEIVGSRALGSAAESRADGPLSSARSRSSARSKLRAARLAQYAAERKDSPQQAPIDFFGLLLDGHGAYGQLLGRRRSGLKESWQ